MLYKVTPAMLPPVEAKIARVPGQARPRRKTAIFDSEGHEVLITLMCLKCKNVKPLAQFGLRRMPDGAIRNQPWCRPCRSAASSKKPKVEEAAVAPIAPAPSGSSEPYLAAEHDPNAPETSEVVVEAMGPDDRTGDEPPAG